MGQATQGVGLNSTGTTFAFAGQTWEPSVIYLIALLIAEMFVFGLIGRMLK